MKKRPPFILSKPDTRPIAVPNTPAWRRVLHLAIKLSGSVEDQAA